LDLLNFQIFAPSQGDAIPWGRLFEQRCKNSHPISGISLVAKSVPQDFMLMSAAALVWDR